MQSIAHILQRQITTAALKKLGAFLIPATFAAHFQKQQ